MSGSNPGYVAVPEVGVDQKEHNRRLARAINNLLQGKMNAVSTITLTANAATTTLTDARLSSKSFIGFMPTTANAAAALSGLYVTNQVGGTGVTPGTAIINHANNAQIDKTFTLLIIG